MNVKNTGYSLSGLMNAASHGQGERQPTMQESLLRHRYQAPRVGRRVQCSGKHEIVTGHFALGREAAANQPNSGMKKEYSSQNLLSEICPIIPPAQVGQLVKQDCIHFLEVKIFQRPRRKNDSRLNKA